MKIIEAIGKGFGIANKNFGILGVLFIFNLIWNLAPLPFLGAAPTPSEIKPTPPMFALALLFILINIFIQGGVFGILKDVLISDEKAVLANLVRYGKRFYLRFLGLGLVILGLVAIGVLIIGLIITISVVVKNVIVNILAVSAAVILSGLALYYLFLIFLSPYILVVEDAAVFKALKGSLQFVKKHLWKISGLTTLLVLIGLGIGFIAGVVTGILSFALKGLAFQIATAIITGGINAYITVIISAALMVYYYVISGAEQRKDEVTASA